MIKLEKVLKDYGNGTIIDLIDDIKFEDGKSYCILGPSGSGKSTLLNLIAGIIKPSQGRVVIDDVEITALSVEEVEKFRRDNIGYISQEFNLFELMTVMDNLGIMSLVNHPTKSILEVLNLVGLGNKLNSKINSLSGGEKQRVAIARSLLNSPSIMLCDEPTGSLNYKMGREIMELLIDTHKLTNNTLLVVTHDDRMSNLFDNVISFESLLKDGYVI